MSPYLLTVLFEWHDNSSLSRRTYNIAVNSYGNDNHDYGAHCLFCMHTLHFINVLPYLR